MLRLFAQKPWENKGFVCVSSVCVDYKLVFVNKRNSVLIQTKCRMTRLRRSYLVSNFNLSHFQSNQTWWLFFVFMNHICLFVWFLCILLWLLIIFGKRICVCLFYLLFSPYGFNRTYMVFNFLLYWFSLWNGILDCKLFGYLIVFYGFILGLPFFWVFVMEIDSIYINLVYGRCGRVWFKQRRREGPMWLKRMYFGMVMNSLQTMWVG